MSELFYKKIWLVSYIYKLNSLRFVSFWLFYFTSESLACPSQVMPSSLFERFILFALDYITKRTRFQWNHFIANPNKFIRISVTQKVSSSGEFIELLKKFQFKKWNTSKLSFQLFQFQIIWNFFFKSIVWSFLFHEKDLIYISKSMPKIINVLKE